MPALNEKDYAEFCRLIDELAPEVASMKETPQNFLTGMIDKRAQYGERMFVSPKQLAWIRKLHEEFVGDTEFEDEPEGRFSDGGDQSNETHFPKDSPRRQLAPGLYLCRQDAVVRDLRLRRAARHHHCTRAQR